MSLLRVDIVYTLDCILLHSYIELIKLKVFKPRQILAEGLYFKDYQNTVDFIRR